MSNRVLSIGSTLVLLVAPIGFGYLGQTVEMGLAVVAGSLGLAFSNLDKISRFKGAGFEAEMRDQQLAEAVIVKQTEDTDALKSLAFDIDSRRQAIMHALLHTNYQSRYISGLAADTGYSKECVRDELDWLKESGLVEKRNSTKGYLWNLTEKGMAVLPIVVFGKNEL
ncbi:ArsR family transcriptional regulator [Vibrio vulnificus]|nr:ArsR family transcriptional regulator [Vibrio vulnificus]